MPHKGGAVWVGLNEQDEDLPFNDPKAVAWFNTVTSQKTGCKPPDEYRYEKPRALVPQGTCAVGGRRRKSKKTKKSKKSIRRRRSTRRS
jgi:hypothetical protein